MYITDRHPICCTNTTDYCLIQYIPGIQMLPVFPFTVITDINQSYLVQLLWLWLAVTESFQTGSQLHRYTFLHHWPTNLEGGGREIRLQHIKWYGKFCNTWIPYPFIFQFQIFCFGQIIRFCHQVQKQWLYMHLSQKNVIYIYMILFITLYFIYFICDVFFIYITYTLIQYILMCTNNIW